MRFLLFTVCMALGSESFAELAVVSKVVTGDTIETAAGRRIQLHGIDAPSAGKPGGRESWEALSKALKGRQVELRNQNGNTAAVVVDGRDVALELLRRGLAWVNDGAVDPGYRDAYEAAFLVGRRAQRGIWELPNPPWQIRPGRSSIQERPVVAKRQLSVTLYVTGGCAPCAAMKPVVEQVVADLQIPYSATYARAPAWRANVQQYPTLVVTSDGVELGRLIGASDYETLRQYLERMQAL